MLLEYSIAYIVGLIAVVLVGGLYLGAHVLFWLGVVDEFDLNTTTKNTIIWFLIMILILDVLPWVVGLLLLPPWGK